MKASINAAALPTRDVSKEAMYFGILNNKILPGATVLGFSRSGNYINKKLLCRRSEVYNLVDDLDPENIQETKRSFRCFGYFSKQSKKWKFLIVGTFLVAVILALAGAGLTYSSRTSSVSEIGEALNMNTWL